MKKISLENVHDFLGSKFTKLIFAAIVIMFVGSFLLTLSQSSDEAWCGGVEVVLEHNIGIERNLIKEGRIDEAKLLHRSLVNLTKRADYCNMSKLKKLLKGNLK